MESILSLFVFHDTYVVSFLVIGITIIVVMLLLFNNKGPSNIVRSEIEGSENIEGALRRVLGEKNWSPDSAPTGTGSEKVDELEKEVLEKDRKIAELNKQLTQSSGSGGDSSGGEMSAAVAAGANDNSDLLAKISELEERLMEYEIIEDDIADLSLYKTENEKLKEELERLKALAGGEESGVKDEQESEPNDIAAEESTEEPKEEDSEEVAQTEPDEVPSEPEVEPQSVEDEEPPQKKVQPADLVAEFEKVVNNQVELDEEGDAGSVQLRDSEAGDSGVQGPKEESGGTVTMKDTDASKESSSTGNEDLKNEIKIHPKLRNVDPDSKEEAEVFITELKSLKKGSRS